MLCQYIQINQTKSKIKLQKVHTPMINIKSCNIYYIYCMLKCTKLQTTTY